MNSSILDAPTTRPGLHLNSSIIDALAIVAVGGFFLTLALMIESSEEGLVGPRLVPLIIASLIIFLGGLQLVLAFIVRNGEESELGALSKSAAIRMAIVIGLGFVYIWLFAATGYLISTTLVLGAMLVLFDNRPAVRVALLSIFGGVTYYLLFIKLMGIYETPGWLIDLGNFGL